jgi:O-antigen/teichoic acid export membrane protein
VRFDRLARIVRAGGWGLLDQALISAASFVLLILLARSLTPHEFGAFTLVYGAMLVANYAQTAFVTQPHNVIGASLTGRDYRVYTRSLLVVQLGLSAALALAAALAALVAAGLGPDYARLLLAAAAALPLWQLQELVRRVLYTEGRQRAAFGNDAVAYGGLATGVAALAIAGSLSAPAALAVLAVSAATAAAAGSRQIRSSLGGVSWSRSAVAENLHFGKWLAGSFAAQWTATQAYLYIAALLLGVAVTGALKAVQLILSPLHVLLFSLSTMLPIRLSRTLAREPADVGETAFHHEARLAFRVTFPVVAVYCGLVALFADQILELLYGETYAGYGRVLVIFAAYYLLLYAVFLASALLTAQRRTNRLFLGNAVAAVVTVVAAWPLMRAFEAEGAALLLVVSAAALNLALWQPWAQSQRPARPRDDSAPARQG